MSQVSFLHPVHLNSEPERVLARRQGVLDFLNEKKHQKEKIDEKDFSSIFAPFFTDEELDKIGQRNCQNLIGGVVVPVGVAGPVVVQIHERIDGEFEEKNSTDFLLPVATTEGALVASIQRGCKALSTSGGVTVLEEYRGMTRAPVFECSSGVVAQAVLSWVQTEQHLFRRAAEQVSTHLKFLDVQGWVEGRLLFLRCRYDADQAMGMNMVTIATQRAADALIAEMQKLHPEHTIELLALSSNVCTDKKTSAINQLLGRGWWVQAEAFISEEVLKTVLKTSADQLIKVHQAKNQVGTRLAGSSSANMHIANCAAAFFLATGQDLAHVVDVSQGTTSIERAEDGIYAAVTLPTVPVGVVGGGTWLPTQRQARLLMTGKVELRSGELAAGLATTCLAGELSGLAALASHDLAQAHQRLGRESK